MGLIFNSDDTAQQGCGGTLVGDRYVITTAQCASKSNDIRIIVGDTTLGVANDTHRFITRVSEIRQHPKFMTTSYDRYNRSISYANDISVLVLSTPVDLKVFPNIKPACLPKTETKSELFGRSAVGSGWGTVGVSKASHLNEVAVKILPYCGKLLRIFFFSLMVMK